MKLAYPPKYDKETNMFFVRITDGSEERKEWFSDYKSAVAFFEENYRAN